MPKPILLAVDDDPSVLEAVVEDLRRKYGETYRVVRAASGQAALDICRQLQTRNDQVALFLSDQRMPGMTGVEFLEQAVKLYPEAKRVLLTAYADTEAAIRAINSARIHYYLMKPWDPPEQNLYPVLDDLLESWNQDYKPPFDGLTVIGNRYSRAGHEIRDFLSRNSVPYRWLNPDANQDAAELLGKHNMTDAELPVVVFPDGSALSQPEKTVLASKIGLRVTAEKEFYDLVILGAGPAGLGAAVYGASEGLKTLAIEPAAPGGQAGSSARIENYLGFPSGLSGGDLARRAFAQASRFGAEFLTQRVVDLRFENQYRIVKLEDGKEISTHVCLIATGVDYRKLDVPGLEDLTGRGVYYGAAMTEAISCKDEEVYIIGGANSAGQAAMHFSKFAAKVFLLVRATSLDRSMSRYLIDQIEGTPNIQVETECEVLSVSGQQKLDCLKINSPRGVETRQANGLFIFIGAEPKTAWLPASILRDAKGFILTGREVMTDGKLPPGWKDDRDPYFLETSVSGVFAAGDVRCASIKRVASAVGEGSMAVQFAHQYLAGL